MPDRLQYLFDRHLAGTLTGEERYELMGMALDPAMQEQVKQMTGDAWDSLDESEDVSEETKEELLGKLFTTNEPTIPSRFNWRRLSIAASLLIALATGAYFLFFNKQTNQPPIATNIDIKAPETNKAVIELPDGQLISLDTLTTYTQGSVTVTKTADGRLVYTGFGSGVRFNTLTNPRGSKVIDIELVDHSHVWLNAGSSITYPVAFTGNDRKVTMTGEAYFKIAHNSSMPFTVSKGEMNVTVLGTEFNVNAYDDEPGINVTVLQGSVKVNNGASSGLLKPGQQAQVGNAIKVVNDVDVDAVMAWKNGLFNFNRADMKTIMRQIARWYDVEVVYAGNIESKQFGGEIGRDITLSKLLPNLEKYGIKMKLEGRTITVSP